MVRGEGTARLAHDVRVRQAALVADLGERADDIVRVLLHRIVHGAEAARARALVVHAEAAADVDDTHRRAELPELRVVARRLAHAGLDVLDIGDLRAHVEVHHGERLEQVLGAQPLDHAQHLGRGQSELGFLAAGVLPLARPERGQPHAHAQKRRDVQRARLRDHELELGELLDHDVDPVSELLADQGQPDELPVLVAVADHDPVRARAREHRQQLGLAARLEPQALGPVGEERIHHAALLVDLDRVDRGIAAAIIVGAHGAVEGGAQLAHPVREDAGKAHQHREREVVRRERARELVEIDTRVRGAWVGAAEHLAALADVEVAVAPVGDVISIARLLN